MKAASNIWTNLLACIALGIFLAVYQRSHAFRDDLSWMDLFALVFFCACMAAAVEAMIANAVAKGIVQAKAQEIKQLEKESAKAAKT